MLENMQEQIFSRYLRQEVLPEIGKVGQARIRSASVAIVGCGALGSVMAELLTRAGVGRLILIDRDVVELTNLQRQSLYDESDARESRPKALALASHLNLINSDVLLEPIVKDLNWRNAELILKSVDIILDGTDNFESRFLINEVCVKHKIPWVYGGAIGTKGMATLFHSPATPCFKCILSVLPKPEETPTCDTAGIMAPIVHWVSSLEVTLTFKFLLGDKTLFPLRLYALDIWRSRVDEFPTRTLKSTGRCPTCEEGNFPFLSGEAGQRARALCGRNAVELAMGGADEINLTALGKRLSSLGEIKHYPSMLRLTVQGEEILLFDDGRAIVQGTTDIERARTLYAKYIGA